MAISSGQVTVSTTPVELHTADPDGVDIIINASQNIYIGRSDVSTETGYLHTKTDPPLFLMLGPDEVLYAVRAGSQDAVVTSLRTKNQ